MSISSLIDTSCPIVSKVNWDSLCEKGWRWHVNILMRDEHSSAKRIRKAQQEYGRKNVAIGDPFDKDRMRPKRNLSGIVAGLYVCDIDDQIISLMATLDIDPRQWVVLS